MFKLPFIIPEEDLELNLILLLMIVNELNTTSTGKYILNNERLQLYFYLVRNPHILNKLLSLLSKKQIELKSYELSSFKANRNNIETLYDTTSVMNYLQLLVSKQLIDVKYDEKIGFIYFTTSKAHEILEQVNSIYFKRVSIFINKLKQTRSTTLSAMNTNLKKILHKG